MRIVDRKGLAVAHLGKAGSHPLGSSLRITLMLGQIYPYRFLSARYTTRNGPGSNYEFWHNLAMPDPEKEEELHLHNLNDGGSGTIFANNNHPGTFNNIEVDGYGDTTDFTLYPGAFTSSLNLD
jgi:hypothetical protein